MHQIVDTIINVEIYGSRMEIDGELSVIGTLLDVNERTRDGDTARITVNDNGLGIEKKIMAKIFDPFFTTKNAGTGLGLSVSYHIIVNNHHGSMNADSEPGKGDVFIINLPVK